MRPRPRDGASARPGGAWKAARGRSLPAPCTASVDAIPFDGFFRAGCCRRRKSSHSDASALAARPCGEIRGRPFPVVFARNQRNAFGFRAIPRTHKKEMRFRGLASGIRAESERFCTLVVSRVALKRAGFHLKTPQSRCGMASGDPRTRVRGCVPAVASAWSRVPTPALACGVLAARFRYRTPRRGSCISRPARGSYNDGSWKAGKGRERCQPSSASAQSTT